MPDQLEVDAGASEDDRNHAQQRIQDNGVPETLGQQSQVQHETTVEDDGRGFASPLGNNNSPVLCVHSGSQLQQDLSTVAQGGQPASDEASCVLRVRKRYNNTNTNSLEEHSKHSRHHDYIKDEIQRLRRDLSSIHARHMDLSTSTCRLSAGLSEMRGLCASYKRAYTQEREEHLKLEQTVVDTAEQFLRILATVDTIPTHELIEQIRAIADDCQNASECPALARSRQRIDATRNMAMGYQFQIEDQEPDLEDMRTELKLINEEVSRETDGLRLMCLMLWWKCWKPQDDFPYHRVYNRLVGCIQF